MKRFRNMLRRPRGATATEYLVIILLAAMVLIAMVKVFGGTLKTKFTDANDELSGTLASEAEQRDRQGGEQSASGAAGGAAGSGGSGAAAGAGGGAGGSGGSGGSGGGGKEGAGAGGAGGGGSGADAVGGGGGALAEDESPGFNPVILLAALGLVGLLVYVMVKGKN